MKINEVNSRVREILEFIYSDCNGALLGVNDDLTDVFPVDSLGFIQLIVEIENKFGITIDPELLIYDKLNTIEKITKLIFEHEGVN